MEPGFLKYIRLNKTVVGITSRFSKEEGSKNEENYCVFYDTDTGYKCYK